MTITTGVIIAQRMRQAPTVANSPTGAPYSPSAYSSPGSSPSTPLTARGRGSRHDAVNAMHALTLEVRNNATTVQMHRSVTVLNESFRPTNTAKCHSPKIHEYFEYCDAIYPDDPYKYILTSEKVFWFMFYQSFRDLKPRGGKKRQMKRNFDIEGYNAVLANFDGSPRSPGHTPMPIQSKNPISWSTFDQYKQVIAKIYQTQKMEKVHALYWEDIWQQPCKDLSRVEAGKVPSPLYKESNLPGEGERRVCPLHHCRALSRDRTRAMEWCSKG
jgi:hypothetical protein